MQPPPPRRTGRAWILPPILAAVILAAPSVAAQHVTLATVMRDTALENGLRLIVVPNPTVPLVTIQVTIHNGAFTQLDRADEGVPHLLEHMLFRSFRSNGFGEAAGKLNARYNGTTGDETVTYYGTLPLARLDGGVRLLADLMRAPRFERNALDADKRVVRGELERSAASPGYLPGAMVDQKLWGEASGRKNAIANLFTINGATPATWKT
jgi:zinc protease